MAEPFRERNRSWFPDVRTPAAGPRVELPSPRSPKLPTSRAFAENQGDYPVGGVSWYEAAAYAEFAGKSLPTVAHWQRAALFGQFSEILKRNRNAAYKSIGKHKASSRDPLGLQFHPLVLSLHC